MNNLPKIYAYTTPQYKEKYIKIGYTARNVEQRIQEQFPVKSPEENPFKILLEEEAIKNNNEFFTDTLVHHKLEEKGFERINGEWFECSIQDIKQVITEIKTGKTFTNRFNSFSLRPEQENAIKVTSEYFKEHPKESHFLWNAKMRFGKTFTAYKLAQEMGWKKILILTYKPAVQSSWKYDLNSHIDFEGWQFIDRDNSFDNINEDKPFVWFASFQDIMRKNKEGNIKNRLELAYVIDWDCIIIDEYHFGAWRDSAKELYQLEENEENFQEEFPEDVFKSNHYLYLSGTPFKAIASGEFSNEQIFNWTYYDEQLAKKKWDEANGKNPYEELPQMEMRTYKLPDKIREVALTEDKNEFSLNLFFKTKQEDGRDFFINENEVQQWLNVIRGEENIFNNDKNYLPFQDSQLLPSLNHIFWFMPNVSSCRAMKNLLEKENNKFYHEYKILVIAGIEVGCGVDSLFPVKKAIKKNKKTIILSCGKLTTGVTIPELTTIFFLRDIKSPETYFQTAFRCQSPFFKIENNKKQIYKKKCFIVDFSPNRALELIVDYCTKLNKNENKQDIIENKIKDFINFLPILCYDGFSLEKLKVEEILDFVATGDSSNLLANKWESFKLINLDVDILQKMKKSHLIEKLNEMEDFRALKTKINTVISNDDAIHSPSNNSFDEKEQKKYSKQQNKIFKSIREKLLKFITRIPIFMYLTDYREECLQNVIENIESDLFEKSIGLTVDDFKELCDLGVFNLEKLNQAVFSFKRFEENSLFYIEGIKQKEKRQIGGFNEVKKIKSE